MVAIFSPVLMFVLLFLARRFSTAGRGKREREEGGKEGGKEGRRMKDEKILVKGG